MIQQWQGTKVMAYFDSGFGGLLLEAVRNPGGRGEPTNNRSRRYTISQSHGIIETRHMVAVSPPRKNKA